MTYNEFPSSKLDECKKKKDKVGFKSLCVKWMRKGYCKVLDLGEVYCNYTCTCMRPDGKIKD